MINTRLEAFEAGNEDIEVVKSFKFRGSLIEEKGDCKADIARRLAMVRGNDGTLQDLEDRYIN